jgi:hypothetical protein
MEPPAEGIRPADPGLTARFEVDMRKLIAGTETSVDAKIEGPEGAADWVEAKSEDYGLTPQVDASVLGEACPPATSQYWANVRAREADVTKDNGTLNGSRWPVLALRDGAFRAALA